MIPGLGPVRIAALLDRFGSAQAVLGASHAELRTVRGLGDATAAAIAADRTSDARAREDADRALNAGVSIVTRSEPGYSPLLGAVPAAPALLYVKGHADFAGADRFPIAVVGSRQCTPYGIEQAERFAGVLARSGLSIVSGGARGIDTAAHRGALRSQGRTLVVMGCGLDHTYPPENAALFAQVVEQGGCLISELPMATAPTRENFPSRNRIISGISLGVLLIEAGVGSGALITAKLALEDHNREVFAIPGRVDSPASCGSLELLKSGGAALVTDPGDVLSALEGPARHLHEGTHTDRFAPAEPTEPELFQRSTPMTAAPSALLEALDQPQTIDQLAQRTGLNVGALRAEVTLLEIQKRVTREGALFARRG